MKKFIPSLLALATWSLTLTPAAAADPALLDSLKPSIALALAEGANGRIFASGTAIAAGDDGLFLIPSGSGGGCGKPQREPTADSERGSDR